MREGRGGSDPTGVVTRFTSQPKPDGTSALILLPCRSSTPGTGSFLAAAIEAWHPDPFRASAARICRGHHGAEVGGGGAGVVVVVGRDL